MKMSIRLPSCLTEKHQLEVQDLCNVERRPWPDTIIKQSGGNKCIQMYLLPKDPCVTPWSSLTSHIRHTVLALLVATVAKAWRCTHSVDDKIRQGPNPQWIEGCKQWRRRQKIQDLVTRPGKRLHNYGKIHHCSWENSLFLWPFSIAMLNYQRVYLDVPSYTIKHCVIIKCAILELRCFFLMAEDGESLPHFFMTPKHKNHTSGWFAPRVSFTAENLWVSPGSFHRQKDAANYWWNRTSRH